MVDHILKKCLPKEIVIMFQTAEVFRIVLKYLKCKQNILKYYT